MVSQEKNRGGHMELQQLTENPRVFVAVMGKPHSWRPCEQLNHNNQPLPALHPVLTYLADSGIRLLFALDLSRPRTSVYAGSRYLLKRNPIVLSNFKDLALFRKVPHEGIRLYPGDAVWLYSADCPIVIAQGEGALAVGHCGRDGLLSKHSKAKDDIVKSSVLYALVHSLGCTPQRVRVYARVGICPAHFRHPVTGIHAEENRRILSQARTLDKFSVRDRDYLALETVISAQCMAMGIPRGHITWTQECPACEKQQEQLWSHRRWVASGRNGPDGMNGVFVAYLP